MFRQAFLKQNFVLLILLVFVLSIFGTIVPVRVGAAISGVWVDASHIKVGEKVYIDSELGDRMDYSLGGASGCVDVIKGFNKNYGESGTDYSKANYVKATKDPRTGNCARAEEDIVLGSPANALILFHWVDGATLQSVSDGELYKLLEGTTNEYLQEEDDDCKNSLIVKSDTQAEIIYREDIGSCREVDKETVGLGTADNRKKAAGTGTAEGTGDLGSGTERPSCEVTAGSQLSWIMCPLINGIATFADWIFDTIIIPFLADIPISTDPDSDIYKIWSGFRIIANVMLVGILLAVVLAQAKGQQ